MPACAPRASAWGPCELMDLIGHDTNFAVTNRCTRPTFSTNASCPRWCSRDGRWRPAGPQERARLLHLPRGAAALPVAVHEAPATAGEVTVHGEGAMAEHLEQTATRALGAQGWGPARVRGSGWTGLEIDGARLRLTDGRTAADVGRATGLADVAVFDRPLLLSAAHGRRWPLPWPNRPRQPGAPGRRLAGRAGLRAAARGRHAGPGGGAHRGHADQRSGRCRAAGVCTPTAPTRP
jgi:hypothetical protein